MRFGILNELSWHLQALFQSARLTADLSTLGISAPARGMPLHFYSDTAGVFVSVGGKKSLISILPT